MKRAARVAVVAGALILLLVALCVRISTRRDQTGNQVEEEETALEGIARIFEEWRQEAAAKDVDHEFLRDIRGAVTLKRSTQMVSAYVMVGFSLTASAFWERWGRRNDDSGCGTRRRGR